MLEEVVYAILPLNLARAVRFKNRPYENRAYIRKRRERRSTPTEYTEDALTQLDKSMDNAQTYPVKNKTLRKLELSMLLSFLVFYVCFINVIIKCDVSDVNVKKFKEENGAYRIQDYIRDKHLWQGHKYGDRTSEKNIREGRVSTKRETTDSEKIYKYTGPEYYDEYKKEDLVNNVTENSHTVSVPNYAFDNSRAVGYPHDLAANPFFIKKVNSNLEPRFNWFKEKIVKLGVLLPFDPSHVFSLVKVLPILEMAIPAVTKPDGPLPGWKILVAYRDTECSSSHGPLAAFEFYVNGSAGKLCSFKWQISDLNALRNMFTTILKIYSLCSKIMVNLQTLSSVRVANTLLRPLRGMRVFGAYQC